MEDKKPLEFIRDQFSIETCQGVQKLFWDLTTWELLNLKPHTVLDIPDRLFQELGISNDFLSGVMNEFTIQSTGKDVLEKKFGIDLPCQYMLATSRHYSWPKSGAISGIGSGNIIGIKVDNAARVNIKDLDDRLEDNLNKKQAVLAVVAIMGSTEEGAVDPLNSILALRKKYQTKGLSFLVHADAAWGGYFCTMLPKDYRPGDVMNLPSDMGPQSGFVPDACLRAETQFDLYAIRYVDSVTVDPHKAGYIPYPAGGLCYPEWAALTDTSSPFICVPFNELPSELVPGSTSATVEAEKTRIRTEIVEKTNAEIIQDDQQRPDDQKAIKLMRDLGSDLNINAFALNFRYSDGTVNTDVEEANYLMQRVVQAFSVESPYDDPTKIPLYLTSTEFSDELYGDCKANFMKRLQLHRSTQDLMVLRNVVMSPFPTERSFIRNLAQIFYDKVKEETEIVRKRNEVTEDFHSFLMQGVEKIYLIHLPMFHMANHRQQLIISVDIDEESKELYRALKQCNPNEPMILVTQEKTFLREIVECGQGGEFIGQIMTKESGIILTKINVSVKELVVSRPLNSKWRLKDYPEKCMPFYLYGTAGEVNIDHVITRSPNTQFSAAGCTLEVDGLDESHWKRHMILVLDEIYERPMQPFPANSVIGSRHGAVVGTANGSSGVDVDDGEIDDDDRSWRLTGLMDKAPGGRKGRRGGGGGGEGGDEASPPTTGRGNGESRNGSSSGHDSSNDNGNGNGNGIGRKVGGTRGGSSFFFRPGARFAVSVWEDLARSEHSAESARPGPGRRIGRGHLTLGSGDVYVDSEAINFDPYKKVSRVAEWRYEFDQIGKELD
ncbi:hypothetical protein SLS62_003963 [Diatrype stigma]|uniref:Uncharacterized protein n=1 Tax=Diatrype stigma TaxID=117547 RepID=A0AAN9UVT4_9PEZI